MNFEVINILIKYIFTGFSNTWSLMTFTVIRTSTFVGQWLTEVQSSEHRFVYTYVKKWELDFTQMVLVCTSLFNKYFI